MSNTTQQRSAIEQIGSILKVALENSDSLTILSNLASRIGNLFAADACIVVSAILDSATVNKISYWQKYSLLPTEAVEQLSGLCLDEYVFNSSAIVESSSPLFEAVDRLLQGILPKTNWLGAIAQFKNQTNGLVLLLNQSSTWTHREHKLLTQILDPIAIVISQAQLQRQIQTKSRHQTLLKNLSREISQGYQPQLLLDKCLAEVGTALEVDRGMMLMLKYRHPLRAKERNKGLIKGTAKIAHQWSYSRKTQSQPEKSFSLINSDLCQQAWQYAPKCLHFSTDAIFPDLISSSVEPYGQALLMMPLMGKKTSETDLPLVLGFLVLQHDAPRHWSRDELDLIDWVGTQISTALVHHQTLNRVQSIVDERTAQLTTSIDFQAKLSTKMRQHITQLQKANQLKDDFMNSMSHELKTPLTSMKLAIKMLRQAKISPEMRTKYLDILEQEWNREYSLIKDLLTLQQVESGELDYSPQELNLNQTIEYLAKKHLAKLPSDLEVDLAIAISQPDLKIYTDAESLEHILNELLSNAGKYCDPQTKIQILAASKLTAKQEEIVISVTNVGAGITPAELPHIFDKFRRGQGVTDRAVPGTGLGLTLVQYLVEHLNGTIEVTSEPVENNSAAFLTTFTLKLPQIQPTIG